MSSVRCPQCELPAEVIDRFSFASTGGQLVHLKIVCAAGHWFTPRAADVEAIPEAPAVGSMEAMALRRAMMVRRKAA
jgi:hypothetical protein